MSKPIVRYVPAFAAACLAALSMGSHAQAQMRGDFDQADANHDGHVTLQEYEAYATRMLMSRDGPMAQAFRQMSPDQRAARLQQRFEKADSGRKGYLTRQDWSS